MSIRLPALRFVSIRDSAVDALRNALLDGDFQPGESLSEPALAAQMSVSRGPVREALLVLEQEGLVVHHPHRGFSVLSLGPEDRRGMTLVRASLEALALELAKARATPEDLEEMRATLDDLVKSYGRDVRASARADLAFHIKLWELSGNSWLVLALKRVTVPFFLYTIMFCSRTEGLDAATLEQQHRAYLDYLKGTGTLTAEECVRLHLALYDS